ncbi:MAG: ChrR family anti-sigma-E factor [Alphaproteobacteria bacterium]|nr:ChrR family anti-sigma-E factor [Alphaproteobacteria bacterium]
MKISHHLDDATILAFAAGTVGEAHGVLAAAHISLCPLCRSRVKSAEQIAGAILADESEASVSDQCRAATLASLDAILQAKPAQPKPKSDLPLALSRILGDVSLRDIKWKTKAPGVAVFDVPLSKGTSTKLKMLRLGHGRTMPEHGHGGDEITLILKGSYHDRFGRFAPGDVADLDHEIEHQPIVDSDEDCICVVAFETKAKYKTLLAKLAQPFVGI